MRYGAQAQSLIEWLALQLGRAPLPILDVMVGPLQARALVTAVDVGVFRALDEGPKTTGQIAAACACDEGCLGLVLRVVRAMGYLEWGEGLWRTSELGRRHFAAGAADPFGDYAAYAPPQWAWIDRLDEVLRSGRGIDFHREMTPAQWTLYERAMVEHARSFAWFVADRMPVPRGARRCLDVGGGHGLVGAELCRRHPGMQSVVLERPEAVPVVRELASSLGLDPSVRFCAGDLLVDDFAEVVRRGEPEADGAEDGRSPSLVDVGLLCNVLHHFSAEENERIVARLRRALRPGGTIGIFDLETVEEGARAEGASDAFALYFRITSTSACFRAADYESWLRAAGFVDVRSVRDLRLPSRVLVTGRA